MYPIVRLAPRPSAAPHAASLIESFADKGRTIDTYIIVLEVVVDKLVNVGYVLVIVAVLR
jgi:hypothetical protein